MNLSGNAYYSVIDAFTVTNLYPVPVQLYMEKQETVSGNLKSNNTFRFSKTLTTQMSAVWLAPDVIPQVKIGARFSMDLGIKKIVQKGNGEFFVNMTDVFNTLKVRKDITGNGFGCRSTDYYETQAVRFGYGYKF